MKANFALVRAEKDNKLYINFDHVMAVRVSPVGTEEGGSIEVDVTYSNGLDATFYGETARHIVAYLDMEEN